MIAPTEPAAAVAGPERRWYLVHGFGLEVHSNDAETLACVDDTYGAFRWDGAGVPPAAARARIALEVDADGCLVTDSRGTVTRYRDADMGRVGLLDRLNLAVDAGLAACGLLGIHAAAVAVDGRAIVMVARSGGGKSTLAAALAMAGHELLTDEYTVVADDGQVLPYARALHIRPATIDLLPALAFVRARRPRPLGGGAEWAVPPSRIPGVRPATSAYPLGAVLVLGARPEPGLPPSIEPVPAALATVELLANVPAAARDYGATLARVGQVLAGRPTARLRVGRLPETVELVTTWARQRS